MHYVLFLLCSYCFSKIFQTRSDDVIAECMNMFNCLPVADAISRRRKNFLLKLSLTTFYAKFAVLLHKLSYDCPYCIFMHLATDVLIITIYI